MGFFRATGDAVLITGAQQSRQDEMRQRQRRYSYTMLFRTACFVVAVSIPAIPVWAKVVMIGGSIVIPWTAVTAANAGPRRQKGAPAWDDGAGDQQPLALDPAMVIDGTVVQEPHALPHARSPEAPASARG